MYAETYRGSIRIGVFLNQWHVEKLFSLFIGRGSASERAFFVA